MTHTLYSFGERHIKFSVHADVAGKEYELLRKCSVCRRERKDYRVKPGEGWVVRPQKKWPDILACSGGITVSQRVVTDMKAAGLTGYRLHNLTLVNYPPEKAPDIEYYILEPTGVAAYTLAPPADKFVCPHCGMWDNPAIMPSWHDYPDEVLIPGSWDGSDWVRATRACHRFPCCSERVVDLAAEKQWTNAAFGVVSNRLLRGISFDAADKNWRETVNARIAYEVTRRVKPGQ